MSEIGSHPIHTPARSKTAGLLGGLALVGTVAGVSLAAHAAAAGPTATTATTPATPVSASTGPSAPAPPVLAADDATRVRLLNAYRFYDTVKWDATEAWDQAAQRAVAARLAAERAQEVDHYQPTTSSSAAVKEPTTYTSYSSEDASGSVEATLACIRSHESDGDYGAVNSSSGAGGAYQFMPSTWAALGGSGLPEDASASEQDAIAMRAYDSEGWSPWDGDGCV